MQIFLRNEEAAEYLDEALPTGSSLASACPASVLWFAGRLEAKPNDERALESLDKILNEFNPFVMLVSLLRADVFVPNIKVSN